MKRIIIIAIITLGLIACNAKVKASQTTLMIRDNSQFYTIKQLNIKTWEKSPHLLQSDTNLLNGAIRSYFLTPGQYLIEYTYFAIGTGTLAGKKATFTCQNTSSTVVTLISGEYKTFQLVGGGKCEGFLYSPPSLTEVR